ncbi:MAG: type II/IV secretion system protein [Gammaproteobacteria bacterium]|nr:type II/IV secretion system protein [Gammaproteobacteria bacterium]
MVKKFVEKQPLLPLISEWRGEDHPLALDQLLAALRDEGIISEKGGHILQQATHFASRVHPLILIANQEWRELSPPHRQIDIHYLLLWLAQRTGLRRVTIDPLKIDLAATTAVISRAYATRYHILPLEVTADKVVIATAQPYIREWMRELHPLLKKDIEPVLGDPAAIERYLGEFYNLSDSIRKAEREEEKKQPSSLSNLEQLIELGRQGRLDANDQHVVNVVDWLLQYAFEQRASDIHIEPRREVGNIRLRIDGLLHLVYSLPGTIVNAVTSRLKILARMDLAEKRRPQDGRIKTRLADQREIELRLSSMPTAFGEKLVIRIFNPEVLISSYGELGFHQQIIEQWSQLLRHKHGIVLVTGPTGSGKTTTLYSTLRQIYRPEINLCTIEDPIENVIAEFNQTQVQENIDITFAVGVRTLLRQDPDIIMVGEMRDHATSDSAIQAALTGHLVLSTLHTNDSTSAVTRLLDLGVPSYLIQSTLLGVLAQRLVRILCPHCKAKGGVDELQWRELVRPWRVKLPPAVYHPVGCEKCRHSGYLGRQGIYELFVPDKEIRQTISPATVSQALRDLAYKKGMQSLRLDGARKVQEGLTTIDEVLKVVPAPDEL